MSGIQTTILALNGILFALWAFTMFRTLFAQRRRAVQRTGKIFPGPIDALHEWQHWWRAADQTRQRRLLIGLTLALFLTTAFAAVLSPTSG